MDNYPEHFVFIASLGCPKNLVDTEVVAASFFSENIGLTGDIDEADVFLVNTCAFIPPAREEAESVIDEALDWKAEAPNERKVVVCGCLVQWDKKSVYPENYPEVDLWLGIDQAEKAGSRIKALFSKKGKRKKLFKNKTPGFLYDHRTPRLQLTLPHFAYIKIAEGCDNRCSYCTIPSIRGGLRSRTIKSVLKEAESLLEIGVKELAIIAQDSSAFGADRRGRENLSKLLKGLDSLGGDFWIRVLYAHPGSFDEKLVETFASSKHVLPYIDLPLQHISDRILKSMNRKVTSNQIRSLLELMRKEIKDIAIRTTFITGYPGETEEDFEELLSFVKEQEFERMGAFSYYPEKGTKAASFSPAIPAKTAEARCRKLMKIQSKISLKNNKKLVGKHFDVIVDALGGGGTARGRTYMDAPEVDNAVILDIGKARIASGDIVKAKITDAAEFDLLAKLERGGK
jgi:ribosomal protein S12 methylthiotransferase